MEKKNDKNVSKIAKIGAFFKFRESFIKLNKNIICICFFFLRFDYFLKIFYLKIMQLYVFFFEKNKIKTNIFHFLTNTFILNKKQRNKIENFSNVYCSCYEFSLTLPKLKMTSNNKNSFLLKKTKQNLFVDLQVYRDLKNLENLKYYKKNNLKERLPEIFNSNKLFDNIYNTPVNFFFSNYLTLLEKTNKKQIIIRNILEIFNYFYLPLFELSKFDLELLHTVDNENYNLYLMTNYYNNLMLPYEQQIIRFSFSQHFDDGKNIFLLTNLAHTYLTNNIEKYLINLQTLNYYINIQKNYFFNYYNIFYFNQKFYYLYCTLLSVIYSQGTENLLHLQQQSILMYDLTNYKNIYMSLTNKIKKQLIIKYTSFFSILLLCSQLIFFHEIFFVEIVMIILMIFFLIYFFIFQYIILSYDVNLQNYKVTKQIDIEKFYLSNYFLTQAEDLLYFRKAYTEEILKQNKVWFEQKFNLDDEKEDENVDSFFSNSIDNFGTSNFFEKNVNEVLFNVFFEMIDYSYSSRIEIEEMEEIDEVNELPFVLYNYSSKTLSYWFDSLVDINTLEIEEVIVDENNEGYFDSESEYDAEEDVSWGEVFLTMYEEFLENTESMYSEAQLFADADTFSIEELSDFFYEQGIWRYKRNFGNDITSSILLKKIQKKLYYLVRHELKQERIFFFKKYNIQIKKNRIQSIGALQKMVENGTLPYWVIDNLFFSNEIITRYKFYFSKLVKEIEKIFNYDLLFDQKVSLSGTLLDYDFEKLYSLQVLTKTNFTEFISIYLNQVKQSQMDLVGTIDSFSYSAVALNQLLNSLNNNILSIYFPKLKNNKNLKRNQIIFHHYLQFTTVFFEFIPRTFIQKINIYKKIIQHAAFNTVYDVELFFYKYYFSKNYNIFSRSKSTIFLLDMLQYYLKKYDFNYFQIPKKYEDLIKTIEYFEEFEKRSDLQKQVRSLLTKFESSDFWFDLNGELLEFLEIVFFINQEILSENKRTILMQRVAIPEVNDLANINIELATDLLLKYPPYNKHAKLFNEQLLIDLQIPTTLQPVYLFPKYCHTHFICEVDMDFDIEGVLWF
jgi:hypothetical protein